MYNVTPKKIKHVAFAERMLLACDSNPKIPPLHHGRLGWFVSEFEKRFEQKVTAETVRKWLTGEALPRTKSMRHLSEILEVDHAWMAVGVASGSTKREQKLRDATVSGAVNVIAGLVQMTGGNPAFPSDDDDRARKQKIDLYAIIKGAQYAFHVVVAERDVDRWRFFIDAGALKTVILGIIPESNFCFRILELDSHNIEAFGEMKRGGFYVYADATDWSEVTSFSERL